MGSPFPGMDPFLEANPRWEAFHGWFVRNFAELSLPMARELGCWIDVERSVYQREPTGEYVLLGEPDEALGIDTSGSVPSGPANYHGTVALVEPKAVHEIVLDPNDLERRKQEYLVVRELDRWQRVLAVVEVLSPGNKSGGYSSRYREKRLRLLASSAHFMEIDLLRSGESPSRRLFPELPPSPYFIFVARKTPLGRNEEGYPLRLQDSLPVVGLPLGPPRPDLPLDLARTFQAAYDLGIRPGSIDYARETAPEPPLNAPDNEWVQNVVRTALGY